MEKRILISRLERIPYFKLPPSKLGPVLMRVREFEPDRERMAREIRDSLFPEKSIKSVIRGMAFNDARRVDLIRTDRRERVWLAPNGKLVTHERRLMSDRLRVVLRDYSVLQLGLYDEDLQTDMWQRHAEGTLSERIRRFNGLLDHYGVRLPSRRRSGDTEMNNLYELAPHYSEMEKSSARRKLMRSSLAPERLYSLDTLRWRIMQRLLSQGFDVSSFAVDWALEAEWNSEDSIIQLWEGASGDPSSLVLSRKSFQGAILSSSTSG